MKLTVNNNDVVKLENNSYIAEKISKLEIITGVFEKKNLQFYDCYFETKKGNHVSLMDLTIELAKIFEVDDLLVYVCPLSEKDTLEDGLIWVNNH